MSTNTPDIMVKHTDWTDVLAESGKSGKVRVQNKGGHELLVQFAAAKPLTNDIDGAVIPANEYRDIDAEPMIWCRSIDANVRVSVSELV